MGQVASAVALTLLVALAWALSRPRPRLLRSQDASAVAALNRAQITLLLEAPAAPALALGRTDEPLPDLPAAGGARQRALRSWRASLRGQSGLRRQIVLAAAASGDAALLPLLRQARRDPDPEVARTAAAALEAFRRGPRLDAPGRLVQAPRNVARMR